MGTLIALTYLLHWHHEPISSARYEVSAQLWKGCQHTSKVSRAASRIRSEEHLHRSEITRPDNYPTNTAQTCALVVPKVSGNL